MNEYGALQERNGRYVLKFERFFPFQPEHVFDIVTDSGSFSQWYPFATGEMDLSVGGKIAFDDGEGTIYEGKIIELDAPKAFSFWEGDDLLQIILQEEGQGCRMTFKHTFDDRSMVMYMAAGWHRCLDALSQMISGNPIEWKDNAAELREYYSKAFD